ncbi:MAG: hypothetical protein AAF907_05840, partial [Planctomycetota bacterium]
SGANDLTMIIEGRGEGATNPFVVWPGPAALGLLAFILFLEHKHGRGSLRDDSEGPALRVWSPEE